MADDIFGILVVVFGVAGMIWFLWLWPVRLNRTLRKEYPRAKSFFFGFFLSSYIFSSVLVAPAAILATIFSPKDEAVSPEFLGIALAISVVFGLIGYGLLKRRRIVWGGLIGIYWLWAFFVAFKAQEVAPMASAMALLFSAAILVPMTIYVKRRWHELK